MESDDNKLQSTPEKKRVTWKPVVEQVVHFSVSSEAEEGNEHVPRDTVRWDFIKHCVREIRDDSGPSVMDFSFTEDGEEVEKCRDESSCSSGFRNKLQALQDIPVALVTSESGTRIGTPIGADDTQESPTVCSLVAPSQLEGPRNASASAEDGSSCGVLSEEDKRAAMKRRYALLQDRQRMPAEDERRLKRERLRNLVPVWRPRQDQKAPQ